MSEIPISYQIDLKEISTIVKPPLMTTFFHSSGGPIFCLLSAFQFLFMVVLVKMLEKAFYIAKHVLFPKNGVSQVSQSPPQYYMAMSLQMAPKANLAYY